MEGWGMMDRPSGEELLLQWRSSRLSMSMINKQATMMGASINDDDGDKGREEAMMMVTGWAWTTTMGCDKVEKKKMRGWTMEEKRELSL